MTPCHLSPDWSSGTESKSNGSQGQALILMHGRLRRPEAIDVARIPPQELREESIVIHVFQLDNTHDSHETNMCVGDRHINHGFNPCHHCHLPPPLFHVVFPPSPSLFCPILSSPMSLICPSVPVNAATGNMFRQKATEASRILFEFDVNLEVWFEHLHRNWDGIAFTVELSCDPHWHKFKWMDGMGVWWTQAIVTKVECGGRSVLEMRLASYLSPFVLCFLKPHWRTSYITSSQPTTSGGSSHIVSEACEIWSCVLNTLSGESVCARERFKCRTMEPVSQIFLDGLNGLAIGGNRGKLSEIP